MTDKDTTPVTQSTPLVPKAAIQKSGTETVVFVVTGGGVVERRAVKTGGTDGDRIEVVAGLHPGERVVLSPPPTLKDGMKVISK